MSLSLVWAIHKIYELKKIFICAGLPISGTRFDTIYFGRDLDRGWGWWDNIVKKTTEWVDKGVKAVKNGVKDVANGAKDFLGDIVEDLEQVKFINETIHTIEFGAKVAQAYAKCQNLASASTFLDNMKNDIVAVVKPIIDKGNLKQQVENGAVKDALKELFDKNIDHMRELLHCLDDVLPGPPTAFSFSVSPSASTYCQHQYNY